MSDDGQIIFLEKDKNLQVTIFTFEGRPTIRVRKGAQHINLEITEVSRAALGMGMALGAILENNRKGKVR